MTYSVEGPPESDYPHLIMYKAFLIFLLINANNTIIIIDRGCEGNHFNIVWAQCKLTRAYNTLLN